MPTPRESIYGLQKRLRELEDQTHHSATTNSELSELEDKMAFTVVEVQHRKTKVNPFSFLKRLLGLIPKQEFPR